MAVVRGGGINKARGAARTELDDAEGRAERDVARLPEPLPRLRVLGARGGGGEGEAGRGCGGVEEGMATLVMLTMRWAKLSWGGEMATLVMPTVTVTVS